jgi:filamentous hemagglutinin family protein
MITTRRAAKDRARTIGARTIGPHLRLLDRGALLSATALVPVALLACAAPARAQPAANARPAGGQVVAGSAGIGYAGNTTSIDQTSERAAINWQSFSVGSGEKVAFHDPNSSAVTLNRVVGPDPSAIAGRITSNGQLVLVNGSGVVFYGGSQVNAAGLVVSAPGITNAHFMAGQMVFDQPANSGAAIVNQGTLTVRQAGLAALVAPRVANSGTITAKLGHVVLAGAETATLDLYGDGLVSIDVTKAVRAAPDGGAALVTNSGLIQANGGTIQLTARAADGVVRDLVQAGGTIRADTTDGHTGTIQIDGTGGSILIAGRIEAEGTSAGSSGGQIELDASKNVVLSSKARVNASGMAGGGTIAVGTTLARAEGGPGVTGQPTARRTIVHRGARIMANAEQVGSGGHVTVLSNKRTRFAGTIDVKGGTAGGNGGAVEISGGVVSLTGMVDASAAFGKTGSLLIDPTDLIISDTEPTGLPPGDSWISPAMLEAMNASITLSATDDVDFAYTAGGTNDLDLAAEDGLARSLTVTAGNDINIDKGFSIEAGLDGESVPGSLSFTATDGNITMGTDTGVMFGIGGTGGTTPTSISSATISFDAGNAITVLGNLSSPAGDIILTAGAGGIEFAGNVSTDFLQFQTTGALTQPAGVLSVTELEGQAASVTLDQPNLIDTVFGITATTGGVLITEAPLTTLTIEGLQGAGITVPTGQSITLNTDLLELLAPSVGGAALEAPDGTITFDPVTAGRDVELIANPQLANPNALSISQNDINLIDTGTLVLGSATSGTLNIGNVGDFITFSNGEVTYATTLDLLSGAGITENGSGLTVSTLTGAAPVASLNGFGNEISTLGPFVAPQGLSFNDDFDVTVGGALSSTAGIISLFSDGVLTLNANIDGKVVELSSSSAITQTAGTIGAIVLDVNVFEGGTRAPPDAPQSAYITDSNVVGTLRTVSVAGDFVFNDNQALTVAGTIVSDFGSIALTVNGLLTLGAKSQLNADEVVLDATGAAGGIQEVQGAAILTEELTGAAPFANFASSLNQVDTLSDFTISVGNFELTDALPKNGTLLVTGDVAVPDGQTITLISNSLSLTEDEIEGALNAPGGLVVIAPLTAGRALQLVDTGNDPNDLSLTQADLDQIQTGTLQFGSAQSGAILIGNVGDTIDLVGQAGTLDLISGAAISENGILEVASLEGQAQSANFGNQNLVSTLDGFATQTGFTLNNGQNLAVLGPVTDGASVTLNVLGNLTLNGDITAPDVALTGSTAIAQTAGTVDAAQVLTLGGGSVSQTGGTMEGGDLTGNVTGSVALGDAGGVASFNTLGPFTSVTGFTLDNNQSLAVLGAVTDAAGIALSAAGNLTLSANVTSPFITLFGEAIVQTAGTVDAATALALDGGSVSQTGGTMEAGLLVGNVTGSVALGSGGGGAAIATLGAFTSGTGFSLIDSDALTVTGPVTDGAMVALTAAGDLTLSGDITAPDIALAGSTAIAQTAGTVDAAQILNLTGGDVSQSGGTMEAATLTGDVTGSVTLGEDGGTADIGALGAFNSVTGFTLANNQNLSVVGPVTDGAAITLSAVGVLTLSGGLTAPNITLSGSTATTQTGGTVDAAQVLTLGGGNVSQSGGTMEAALLTGDITGALSLGGTGGTALFNTLGAFTSATGFALNNGQNLAVTGPVADAASATIDATGNLTLNGNITAPNITLGGSTAILQVRGNVDAAQTLNLTGGNVSQTGGTLEAALLTGNLTGSAALGTGGGTADIAALGAFTSATGFSLTDGEGLTVQGPVADATMIALNVAGGLTLSGDLTAPNIALTATNAIAQTAGTVDAAQGLTLFGADVSQTGGTVEAALLTGNVTDAFALGNNGGTALIGALGAFTSVNGFTLDNDQGLNVTGPVTDGAQITLAATGDLTLAGNIGAPVISLAASGDIDETGGTVDAPAQLTLDGGNFSQTGGSVMTALLTGSLTGSLAMGNGANGTATIADLGNFSSGTGFTLVDQSALTVTGPVTDATSLALEALAGDLTIAGNATAPNAALRAVNGSIDITGGNVDAASVLSLIAADAVTQSGGVITAGLLANVSGTTVSLGVNGTASIASLGTGTSAGAFTLDDSRSLMVQGNVAAGGDVSLAADGNLSIAGNIGAADVSLSATNGLGQTAGTVTTPGTLTLTGGAISQTGGSLIAADLTGTATGDVALGDNGGTATIGTLSAFTSTGGFALADNQALLVDGPVTGGTNVSLGAVGGLTIAGNVAAQNIALAADQINAVSGSIDAPGALTVSGGTFTQGDGDIDTGTLTGDLTGSANFGTGGGVAAVGALGAFNVGQANLVLNDADALTIDGNVTAGLLQLTAVGSMTLDGSTITTTGAPLNQQMGGAPSAQGSNITVLADPNGNAQFVQTGASTLQSFQGGRATLRIDLPGTGGTMQFAGFSAPDATLVLAFGPGRVTGTLNVGALQVIRSTGSSGLFGSVGGVTGGPAASVATITPAVNPDDLFNNCVIGAVFCAGIPALPNDVNLQPGVDAQAAFEGTGDLQGVPVLPPLYVVQSVLWPADPDVQLPNISDRDY